MRKLIWCLLQRELKLAWRKRGQLLASLAFFALLICLFPLAVGNDKALLQTIAPAVIWVAAMLAANLGLQQLFAQDAADGVLDQFLLCSEPLTVLVLVKIFAHWLVCNLPLVLLAPVLALQLALPTGVIEVLLGTLLLGTPSLSLIGAIGAALTLGLRAGGTLLSLLVLPLSVPILVFATGAVHAATGGVSAQPYLFLLAGFLAAALATVPLVVAAALRIAIE